MYVSMNPSGETGKAIHISQDDTNREVEFIPFDQNGLVKTTSDETVAHINSIKGNTVSFNQLIQNGNFADISNWNRSALASYSASNNIYSWTGNAQYNGIYQSLNWVSGHKYYFTIDVYGTNTSGRYRLQVNESDKEVYGYYINAWETVKGIYDCSVSRSGNFFICDLTTSEWTEIKVRYAMVFDLTLMGIDNFTTTAEVEAYINSHLGNLDYFGFTLGTLIPFNGTGLKTVGFNQWDEEWELGYYNTNTGQKMSVNDCIRSKNYIPVFPNTVYYYKAPVITSSIDRILFYTANKEFIRTFQALPNTTFTTPSNAYYCTFWKNQLTDYNHDICINISDASKNGTYEPYTSNTLTLPTSTYFPTGMKSVGSVYDELSDKAYTRIGSVDLGSLTWAYDSPTSSFVSSAITERANNQVGICPAYENIASWGAFLSHDRVFIMLTNQPNEKPIRVKDSRYTDATTFKQAMTDQNVKLYFELAAPTSTDISLDLTYPVWNGGTEQILPINDSTPDTAPIKANITYPDRTEDTEFLYKQTSFVFIPRTWAFVCKNITQALTLVGNVLKGTIPSGMTSESGKFPLKLKMSDEDGDVFSEKIDLYVERKP